MSYPKATAMILIVETENGFSTRAINWPNSPPDVGPKINTLLANTTKASFDQKYVSLDKAELKSQIDWFIDNPFPGVPETP